MRFGETPPSGRRPPEEINPSRTIFGSVESGFSNEPRPGDLGRVKETPKPAAEQMIAAHAESLQLSARRARAELRVPLEQRAMNIAAAGGTKERLAEAKRMIDRLESQAIDLQHEADVLSQGLEDLSQSRKPMPEFRPAVEALLANAAQVLRATIQREGPIGAKRFESPYVKEARERLEAYQSLLDRLDRQA